MTITLDFKTRRSQTWSRRQRRGSWSWWVWGKERIGTDSWRTRSIRGKKRKRRRIDWLRRNGSWKM